MMVNQKRWGEVRDGGTYSSSDSESDEMVLLPELRTAKHIAKGDVGWSPSLVVLSTTAVILMGFFTGLTFPEITRGLYIARLRKPLGQIEDVYKILSLQHLKHPELVRK